MSTTVLEDTRIIALERALRSEQALHDLDNQRYDELTARWNKLNEITGATSNPEGIAFTPKEIDLLLMALDGHIGSLRQMRQTKAQVIVIERYEALRSKINGAGRSED